MASKAAQEFFEKKKAEAAGKAFKKQDKPEASEDKEAPKGESKQEANRRRFKEMIAKKKAGKSGWSQTCEITSQCL